MGIACTEAFVEMHHRINLFPFLMVMHDNRTTEIVVASVADARLQESIYNNKTGRWRVVAFKVDIDISMSLICESFFSLSIQSYSL